MIMTAGPARATALVRDGVSMADGSQPTAICVRRMEPQLRRGSKKSVVIFQIPDAE